MWPCSTVGNPHCLHMFSLFVWTLLFISHSTWTWVSSFCVHLHWKSGFSHIPLSLMRPPPYLHRHVPVWGSSGFRVSYQNIGERMSVCPNSISGILAAKKSRVVSHWVVQSQGCWGGFGEKLLRVISSCCFMPAHVFCLVWVSFFFITKEATEIILETRSLSNCSEAASQWNLINFWQCLFYKMKYRKFLYV